MPLLHDLCARILNVLGKEHKRSRGTVRLQDSGLRIQEAFWASPDFGRIFTEVRS